MIVSFEIINKEAKTITETFGTCKRDVQDLMAKMVMTGEEDITIAFMDSISITDGKLIAALACSQLAENFRIIKEMENEKRVDD